MQSPDPQLDSPGDLTIWSARAGPYRGPYEIHPYYSLPFCRLTSARGEIIAAATRDPSNLGQLMAGYYWERFADLPAPPAPENEAPGAPETEAAYESSGEDEDDDRLGVTHELRCTTAPLNRAEAQRLAHAVEHRWFYQLYLQDLPIWGMVGEMLPNNKMSDRMSQKAPDGPISLSHHVYQHRELRIFLDDKNDIMKVDLYSKPSSLAQINTNETYTFVLKAQYLKADSNMIARGPYERYGDHNFFNFEARKFSAINNAMIGIFLLALTGKVLKKVLKFNDGNDTPRGRKASNDTEKGIAENLLPSTQQDAPPQTLDPKDVFALPNRLVLLAALSGNGWHLVVWVAVTTLSLQGSNPLEYGPGGNTTRIIWAYAATSIVAGYFSSYHYQQQRAREIQQHAAGNQDMWKMVMLANLLIPPVIVIPVLSITALVSLVFEMNGIIPLAGAARLALLWTLAVVPLQIAGTRLGRLHQARCGNAFEGFPSLSIPPPKSRLDKKFKGLLHRSQKTFIGGMIVIIGLLPFSTIWIQSFLVMTALWNYKFFLVSWFDVAVVVVAVLVTSCSGIFLSLLFINSNKLARTWQWNTFLGGMSTGVYAFCYAVWYYTTKLSLEGLASKINYFGAMLNIIGSVVACGAIAHSAAYIFLRLLYSNIKAV